MRGKRARELRIEADQSPEYFPYVAYAHYDTGVAKVVGFHPMDSKGHQEPIIERSVTVSRRFNCVRDVYQRMKQQYKQQKQEGL